jgi:hypothetical protein
MRKVSEEFSNNNIPLGKDVVLRECAFQVEVENPQGGV